MRALFSPRSLAAFVGVLLVLGTITTYFFGASIAAERARQALESRQHAKAASWLGWPESMGSKNPNVYLLLAKLNRRLDRLETSRDHLEKAKTLTNKARSQGSDALNREQALQDLANRNYPSDIDTWRRLLASAGSDMPEVCEAFVYFRLSRFETQQALQVLDAWQHDYPQDAKSFLLRGKVHLALEQTKEAIQQFEKAVELDADNAEFRLELATVQAEHLQYEEAINNLKRCLAVEPDNLTARALLAKCLWKSGTAEAAQEELAKLLESDDSKPEFLAVAGEIEMQEKNYDLALEYLRKAVDAQPYDREKRYLLARCLRFMGESDEAKREFATVREATDGVMQLPKLTAEMMESPEDIELRYQVAFLSWRYHSREVGLRWFQELLAIDPNHAPSHAILFEHYLAEGDQQKAEFHRRKAGNLSKTPAGNS